MAFRTLEQPDLKGRRALVRVGSNVPMDGGRITGGSRPRGALPTIAELPHGGAKLLLIAHVDRQKGKRVPEMSLKPVVEPLAKLLGAPVAFADDCVGEAASSAIAALPDGGVLLLANVRYHAGEEANDAQFAG